jgi:hypothetical protein
MVAFQGNDEVGSPLLLELHDTADDAGAIRPPIDVVPEEDQAIGLAASINSNLSERDPQKVESSVQVAMTYVRVGVYMKSFGPFHKRG